MGGPPAAVGRSRGTPSGAGAALPRGDAGRLGAGGRPPDLHTLPAPAHGRGVATLVRDRLVPVEPALVPLLSEGGLRRGTTVAVGGAGAQTSLAFALAAGPSRAGSWVAAVGVPHLGARAAAGLGVDLRRLVLVPAVGEQWAVVAAALLEVVDVAILGLPDRGVRPADARRLAARARERGAVLLLLADRVALGRRVLSLPEAWPEPTELRLGAQAAVWEGLGQGGGHLRARAVTVTAVGRRGASRPRSVGVWLPGPDGRVAARAETGGSREADRGGGAGSPGWVDDAVGT